MSVYLYLFVCEWMIINSCDSPVSSREIQDREGLVSDCEISVSIICVCV